MNSKSKPKDFGDSDVGSSEVDRLDSVFENKYGPHEIKPTVIKKWTFTFEEIKVWFTDIKRRILW